MWSMFIGDFTSLGSNLEYLKATAKISMCLIMHNAKKTCGSRGKAPYILNLDINPLKPIGYYTYRQV
jgi:hypothetical protein